MNKFNMVIGVTCLCLFFSAPVSALTVNEIVNKSNRTAYYKGRDGAARVSMVITDSQDRTRKREFSILRWDAPGRNEKDESYCGDQKYYVYFNLPADVNKMVFMVWKHVKNNDDRWLYLPALDLVKRLSSAEKRTSFVGSDFFYEDVSGRNINDDIHELVKDDETFYVLKNTPKDADSVEFSSYTAWIHKKTFLAIKIEYFDRKGEKYREYEALKVENIQNYPTVTRSRMKDLRTRSETVLGYTKVKYNIGLPEKIFTERYLRRAPTKYLK